MRVTVIIMIAVVVLSLAGCTSPPENTGGRPVVAVSIEPQREFIGAVCGDLADIIVMVPTGYSPETYEPTPAEIEALSRADIYFTIGVPSEVSILKGAQGVKKADLFEAAAQSFGPVLLGGGEPDPHVWLSPKRVRAMTGAAAGELAVLFPEHADEFMANAAGYGEKLEELDSGIAKIFEGVSNRAFVSFHPAFGYLASDYGLTMLALEEEGKEANPRRMQELIDFAKAEGIKAIFYQAESDSRQAKAYADEIGGRTVMLSPLAPDYIDNMKKMAETMAEYMR